MKNLFFFGDAEEPIAASSDVVYPFGFEIQFEQHNYLITNRKVELIVPEFPKNPYLETRYYLTLKPEPGNEKL